MDHSLTQSITQSFNHLTIYLISVNFKKIFPSQKFILILLRITPFRTNLFAQMAELVDALVSGTSGRKAVQVRSLFWALF